MKYIFNNSTEVLNHLLTNRIRLEGGIYYREYANTRTTNYKNYEDALNGLKFGMKEYNMTFLNSLKDIESTGVSNNEYFYTDEGLFYDMQEVINGSPECMLDQELEERKQLKVCINLNYCDNGCEKAMINRGISIFKLLYTLITRGYNLDVYFLGYSKGVNGRSKGKEVEIEYHLPKNELNIPTLAFYCSMEFYRLVNFMIVNDSGVSTYETRGEIEYDKLQKIKKENFLIPGGYQDEKMYNLNTVEQADKYITELFNKYTKGA